MGLKVVIFLGPARTMARQRHPLRYQFGNYISKPTLLEGVALFRWICAERGLPDEIIIYGGPDADWDMLHELAAVPHDMPQFQQLGLRQAIDHRALNANTLAPLEVFLREFLGGIQVRCELIPAQMTPVQQLNFFQQLYDRYRRGDELHVDISRDIWAASTFTAASVTFLSQAKFAQIEGIYIAQPALTTMAGTPVMIVGNSNELMEWANALSTVRQNGLIGQLAQLFSRTNPKLAQATQEINFALLTSQYGRLYEAFDLFDRELRRQATQPQASISRFFCQQLVQEMEWLHTGHLADWELEFARRALFSGDFLRATIFTQEAVVSAAIARRSLRVDDAYRSHVRHFLVKEKHRSDIYPVDPWPFIQLDLVRRWLMGEAQVRKMKELRDIMTNAQTLQSALERAISFAAVLLARFKRIPPL